MACRQLQTQVIVVGAGPVGLMLAGELRRGGADVLILEELDAPTTESRASTLHARTMEIFDSRGLLAALGTPPRDLRGHFGGIPLDLSVPSPFAGQWKVPQTKTEELLQDWATGLGARLLRGHRLSELRVGADEVEATADGAHGRVTVRGEYLVGCDGAGSTVRALTATPFPGQPAQRQLLRADVAGIDIPDRRFQRLAGGLAIAARRPDGVTRVMVHEFASAPVPRPGAADVAAAWRRVTGEEIGGGRFLWVNAFGDANRQVARYRAGRVLFAGDAAHDQMPSGGQALNLGLQDAVNLGWKLAAEAAGTAAPGLLDTYHAERHAVGAGVLGNIRVQTTLLLGGSEVEPLRALFAELMELPDVREHLAAMISGLDISYDMGEGDHPLLGRRIPPARLTTPDGPATTAELLRRGRGALIAFDGDPDGRLRDLLVPWDGQVAVIAAAPAGAIDAAAVLVRPDGHIAWTMDGGPALPAALRRWFGASSPVPAGVWPAR